MSDKGNQIAEGAYIGGTAAMRHFTGEVICVTESPPPEEPPTAHLLPIIVRPDTASPAILNEVVSKVDELRAQGKNVIIHCHEGRERAPLTGCWHLVKKGIFNTMEEAYVFVKALRPIVDDRTHWLKGQLP